MAATSAFREPLYFLDGPLSILDAATRSSLIAEMQRAKTASAIVGAGTPMSRALVDVHLPVPFWPAASRTTSTKGLFVTGSLCLRISAVISIRETQSQRGPLSTWVSLFENLGRNLDQKAVQGSLLPLGKDRAHLRGPDA